MGRELLIEHLECRHKTLMILTHGPILEMSLKLFLEERRCRCLVHIRQSGQMVVADGLLVLDATIIILVMPREAS